MTLVHEDTYELSPMQQGMLYHTLDAPASGMYCICVSYRLRGPLVAAAFIDSWNAVVSRHPALRTAFGWRPDGTPVQVVYRHAPVDIRVDDWCDVSPGEQQSRLRDLLEVESRRGFDVTKPPLLRLTLVKCAEAVHELVVSHHHLIMDGSCKALLFQEVFEHYAALLEKRTPDVDVPRPYREFIQWLGEQDLAAAEAFWRAELAGVRAATPLWPDGRPRTEVHEEYAEHGAALGAEATQTLRLFGRRHRLTLNTIVTGMWALLLGRSSGVDDVSFGVTVNCRPPSLEAESTVGLFINTVPIRVRVPREAGVAEWLQARQMHQVRVGDYAFAPLAQVQRWSGVPAGQPLVESLVVFENNPGYGSGIERYGTIAVSDVRPVSRNSFPLTLRCVPGEDLSYQILHDPRRFSAACVQGIAESLGCLLRELPNRAEAPVARLMDVLDGLDRQRQAEAASAFESASLQKLRALRRTPSFG